MIRIIYNPNAGKAQKAISRITQIFKKNKIGFNLLTTNSPGEAKLLAKQISEENDTDILIVVGGDGTVNEVINGLVNTSVPLGIIPAGSLNCIAKEINLSFDPEKALTQILEGKTKTVSIGKISYSSENYDAVFKDSRERYFFLMTSAGIDAGAVFNLNSGLKKIIGPIAYIYSGLLELFKRRHPLLNITVKSIHDTDKDININGYSCIINKLKTYAWFNLAPDAGIEKNYFQVFVFEKSGIFNLLRYSLGIMFGWHKQFSDVKSYLTKNIKISSNDIVYVQSDGETAGRLPVEISIIPGSLRIILPKN